MSVDDQAFLALEQFGRAISAHELCLLERGKDRVEIPLSGEPKVPPSLHIIQGLVVSYHNL